MRMTTLVMIAIAGLAAGGCSMWGAGRPSGPAAGPSAADPVAGRESGYLQRASAAKDAETPLPTAIESTLVLQDKYARALEDLRHEQEKTRELTEQKQQLTDESKRTQADLAKAQQELAEANNLLVQMRTEIEKWKGDVMGFRDELRQSNRAQLDALGKVMTLLGGETAPAADMPPAPVKPAAAAAKSPAAAAAKPAAVATAAPVAASAARPRTGEAATVKSAPAPAAAATTAAPLTSGGGKGTTRANGL